MISQILWLIGAVLTILMSLSTPNANQVPHIQAKIVYSGEDSMYIRTLDEDSARTRLDVPGDNPRWSPDGTKIVFDYSPDGVSSDIYVANADGTGLRQLTDNPAIDLGPVWSPDGTQIVFLSWRDTNYNIEGFESWRDTNVNIYVMDADGSHQVRLTGHPEGDQRPVWSPDGSQIAFQSYRDGNANLYVMNSDGTNLSQLTNYPDYDGLPLWLSSTKIAFVRGDSTYNYQLYTLDADSLAVVQVTTDLVEVSEFRWLPDSNVFYTRHLDMMYLNVPTGVSTRISGWWPYELAGNYDIRVESIEPMPSKP